jgi:hypothetical protein
MDNVALTNHISMKLTPGNLLTALHTRRHVHHQLHLSPVPSPTDSCSSSACASMSRKGYFHLCPSLLLSKTTFSFGGVLSCASSVGLPPFGVLVERLKAVLGLKNSKYLTNRIHVPIGSSEPTQNFHLPFYR